MQTSIATVSISGGLAEKLEAIAAAGFQGIEIFENDLLSFDGTPTDVGKRIRDLGLSLVALQPFRDFEGMPDEQRARTFDRAERKFDIMQELGTDMLLVCSNVSPLSLGGVDRAAADFHELGERAAKRGLRVGFEALAWGRHINDYRDAWEVVRRADHKAIGLVLDTFHTFARKTDLKAMRSIPGDKVFLVQVADAPWLDMDVLSWSRHFRNFPGQGDLPCVDFMEAVQATNYSGPLSLEIFNDQFRAGSTRNVAIDGLRSLVFLMDQLREKTGKPTGLPPMPPRSRCLGIEFIEFAADDHSAAGLAKLFGALGFRNAGKHKSKQVTRWTQGGINLVINSEKEGFAHSHYITHGTSVCALGLKVQNAAETLDRAQKLHDTPFRQAVGPGELEIPAVRGLGGSLIYFVDPTSELKAVWEIEFDSVPGKSADAGLSAVDHVSQSMRYEEMLSWLLFYNSLLDVTKMPTVDVTDPGGIVASQVIQNADGTLRVILNGSQSERTQSSRFLSDYFGSGVQHIAFDTTDIFATAAKLKANGVEILPIPENYYDDLEARFGLAPDLLKKLQAGNILYDRDDAGEYLQLYTQSFENLFFFEIVERRNAYKGFGAPNAPIRLAAQSRQARHPAIQRA
jgi:4-hydroxyphenylpyruvate dioxygenase